MINVIENTDKLNPADYIMTSEGVDYNIIFIKAKQRKLLHTRKIKGLLCKRNICRHSDFANSVSAIQIKANVQIKGCAFFDR